VAYPRRSDGDQRPAIIFSFVVNADLQGRADLGASSGEAARCDRDQAAARPGRFSRCKVPRQWPCCREWPRTSPKMKFMFRRPVTLDASACFVTRSGYSGRGWLRDLHPGGGEGGSPWQSACWIQPRVENDRHWVPAIRCGSKRVLCLYGHDNRHHQPRRSRPTWSGASASAAASRAASLVPGRNPARAEGRPVAPSASASCPPDGRRLRDGTELIAWRQARGQGQPAACFGPQHRPGRWPWAMSRSPLPNPC